MSTRQNILQELIDITSDVIDISGITITEKTTVQDDLNVDSVAILDLILRIELKYSIEFDDYALMGIKTIGDLTNEIENLVRMKK